MINVKNMYSEGFMKEATYEQAKKLVNTEGFITTKQLKQIKEEN